jgi:hypothetical protein
VRKNIVRRENEWYLEKLKEWEIKAFDPVASKKLKVNNIGLAAAQIEEEPNEITNVLDALADSSLLATLAW